MELEVFVFKMKKLSFSFPLTDTMMMTEFLVMFWAPNNNTNLVHSPLFQKIEIRNESVRGNSISFFFFFYQVSPDNCTVQGRGRVCIQENLKELRK